jgi:uncharacterized protein YciI/uncharacterized protein YndB with AHSA1/START domain
MSQSLEPIRIAVLVRAAPERAFSVFTEEIGAWWPLPWHSVGGPDALNVTIEPRVGGLIVERIRDGEPTVWGTITRWDPPHAVGCTWHPGASEERATEVLVRFQPEGDGTRVELEHRGWEAHPRPLDARREYEGGWPTVLGVFTRAVRIGARTPPPSAQAGPPPVLQVVFHHPGPRWVTGAPAREQPGVQAHVDHMRGIVAEGRMVMGGPFLDGTGGGMVVVSYDSLEEAEARAREDPSVHAGLIEVSVRPWISPLAPPPG